MVRVAQAGLRQIAPSNNPIQILEKPLMKNSNKANLNKGILLRSILIAILVALIHVVLERYFSDQTFELWDMLVSLVFDAFAAWPIRLAIAYVFRQDARTRDLLAG